MTNWFEQYYDELVNYAGAIVRNNNLMCEPQDLVNDAYIKFYESGEEFSKEKIKKYISNSFHAEKDHDRITNIFSNNVTKKLTTSREEKCCIKCHEVKPANAFRLQVFAGGKYILGNICKKCQIMKHAKWFAENKEKWNAYMRSRRPKKIKKPQEIHEQWKKANKKYIAKQKEQLTDVYVRSLLKSKIKSPTPQQIEEKRQQLLAKRRESNSIANNKKAA
jgi:hypothetical protein